MSGLAGSGSCQVLATRLVAKLITETDPASRFDTYRNLALRLGYSPCAPDPVWVKPITLNVRGFISQTPPLSWSATYRVRPLGASLTSCGAEEPPCRVSVRITRSVFRSTSIITPPNSQLAYM